MNRHIKDLDRAIKEQETSISLGLRPGTHPASIILPELVVPKSRVSGVNHDLSESEDESPQAPTDVPSEALVEPMEDEKPMKTPRKRVRVKHSRKKSDAESQRKEMTEVQKIESSPEPRSARSSRSLKLTLPSMHTLTALKEESVIDPNEERYCYCNQVSYGEVGKFG